MKDGVYDIIRRDFLPNNVHGVEEADRLARISLGVEKAAYLADQFMDGGDEGGLHGGDAFHRPDRHGREEGRFL